MVSVDQLKEGGIVSIRDELLRQQAEGRVIARTESGDPSFSIPKIAENTIISALLDGKTHYTSGAGITELREAAFTKVRNENGIYINSLQNIIVTSGAMNALYVIFQALSQQFLPYKTKVLVPTPTWTETVDNVELAGLTPVYYSINPLLDDPIDIDEISSKIDDQIIGIVINTPHNPTGSIIGRDVLSQLVNLCASNNIFLISDEAYEHIVFDPYAHVSPGSLLEYDKIISVFSCSKSYAMSGLRVGYVACNDSDIFKKMSKMVRCTINGVNSASQWGAAKAILQTPIEYYFSSLQEYTNRRNKLFAAAQQCSFITPILPKGAFYVWAKVDESWPGLGTDELGWDATMYLLENGVGSAPGDVFGPAGAGYVRFSFSCSNSNIDIAANIIKTL